MTPRNRILLSLLLATLTACSDPPPAAAKATVTEKEIPTANPNDDDRSREVLCEPSIHPFWKKFRAAVLAEDLNAIADMTNFPLTTGVLGSGSVGSGPANRLSRAEFKKQLPKFLSAPPRENYADAKRHSAAGIPFIPSMKELFETSETLEQNACVEFKGLLRLDRWAFALDSETGIWKLVMIDTTATHP